jgi:hypothetical protein
MNRCKNKVITKRHKKTILLFQLIPSKEDAVDAGNTIP